ncbi:MAG: cation:proton antiporter [Sphingomonadaceae bacterium]
MNATDFNIGLAICAGAVLFLTLVGGAIRSRLPLSQPLLCVLIGIGVGPVGFDLLRFDPAASEAERLIFEQAARVTVALSVMSAALRLPDGFFLDRWRPMAVILGLGMLLMWLAASGLALLLPGLTLLGALVLGALVTPTDPVLAGSIVQGRLAEKAIPAGLRHRISAESGANDGLALPLLLLPMMLAEAPGGATVAEWLFEVLLFEVVGAAIVGCLVGAAAGWAFTAAQRNEFAEGKSVTAATLALTLATLAAVRLGQADGLLAVFTAGLAFSYFLRRAHDEKYEHFHEAVDRFFTLPVFILFGVALPWPEWESIGWSLFAAAFAVLLLRRLPAWLLLGRMGGIYARPIDTAFAGWFGPVGVAAMFYAAYAMMENAPPLIWPFVSLVVALSVLVHGISATSLTRLYAQRSRGEARQG